MDLSKSLPHQWHDYLVSKLMGKTHGKRAETNGTSASGLLLYYHQYSIYSQKVLMAFYQKELPFDSHIINLIKGEQLSTWFLDLNPRGEIPILRNGAKLIPDSGRIIDYLEENYTNGYKSLMPSDLTDNTKQKITQLRKLLDGLPIGAITKGSFFHPELCKHIRMPFIGPVRKILKMAEMNSAKTLREHAEMNPGAKEILLKKADFQEKKFALLTNKEEYLMILDNVSKILDEVEKELNTHRSELWLCGDSFTVADISLSILLERLDEVGLSHRFWNASEGGTRPCVAAYYKRVQMHSAFIKTVPSFRQHLVIILKTQSTCVIVMGGLVLSGLFVATTIQALKLTKKLLS